MIFFPIVEITLKDGETVYRYMYPDGNISASFVRQSELKHRIIRINSEIEISAETVTDMLCLSEREQEFFEAATRCAKGDLEVFEDFETNSFVVKNYENGNEYRVRLETANGLIYGSCECADYTYRNRICKHLSKVLAKCLTQAVFA